MCRDRACPHDARNYCMVMEQYFLLYFINFILCISVYGMGRYGSDSLHGYDAYYMVVDDYLYRGTGIVGMVWIVWTYSPIVWNHGIGLGFAFAMEKYVIVKKNIVIGVVGLAGAGKSTIIEKMLSRSGKALSMEQWIEACSAKDPVCKDSGVCFIEIPDGFLNGMQRQDIKQRYAMDRILCIDAPIASCSVRSGKDLDYAHALERRDANKRMADEMIVNTCRNTKLSWVAEKLLMYYSILHEIEETSFSVF